MRSSIRLRRLARRRKGHPVAMLSLVALMDMFTNLVFFLLANQGATHVTAPNEILLPDSYVEAKARPSVVITVSETEVLVDGQPLATIADILTIKEDSIPAVRARLMEIKTRVIGLNARTDEQSDEVTIVAHKVLPFKVMKKLMSTSASAGYSKISLAVNQKSASI